MKARDIESTMSAEIRRRMEDDGWNYAIAGRVLAARRKRTLLRAFAGTFSGAALATALAFFVILPGRVDTGRGALYDFVSAQVNGAYEEAFAGAVKADQSVGAFAANDETEAFIDAVMMER